MERSFHIFVTKSCNVGKHKERYSRYLYGLPELKRAVLMSVTGFLVSPLFNHFLGGKKTEHLRELITCWYFQLFLSVLPMWFHVLCWLYKLDTSIPLPHTNTGDFLHIWREFHSRTLSPEAILFCSLIQLRSFFKWTTWKRTAFLNHQFVCLCVCTLPHKPEWENISVTLSSRTNTVMGNLKNTGVLLLIWLKHTTDWSHSELEAHTTGLN